ncbi:alpha/beta fold hydrolase [Terrabacter sp. NPDC080008]|uniref:alpha/beta fold hydrolase n=1 Tax=Terrabacter sp. NPDC080008 TaxID=3155176 RepID=UPI00344E26E1
MHRLELDNGHLTYTDTGPHRGDGLVVLLHGGGLDHRMWDDQVPVLARTHRVVVPDLRGHGLASTLDVPIRHCDDVAALVRHLDAGPAILVGVSMGGGAATDTALEHPDAVRAIVVSGTGTSAPTFSDPWVLGILEEWQRSIAQRDAQAYVEASLAFCAGPQRSMDEVGGDTVARCRRMLTDTLARHASPDAVMPQPVEDAWDRLGEIDVPVLALCGALDSRDHRDMGRRLAAGVRRGRYEEVPDGAHYPNMEQPAAWNAAVDAFVAEACGATA